jgi:hypothetical protein
MTDHILSQFVVDDFDGETAILYGPQGPFQMMEGPSVAQKNLLITFTHIACDEQVSGLSCLITMNTRGKQCPSKTKTTPSGRSKWRDHGTTRVTCFTLIFCGGWVPYRDRGAQRARGSYRDRYPMYLLLTSVNGTFRLPIRALTALCTLTSHLASVALFLNVRSDSPRDSLENCRLHRGQGST